MFSIFKDESTNVKIGVYVNSMEIDTKNMVSICSTQLLVNNSHPFIDVFVDVKADSVKKWI